jgi:FkbM family methyltransferase
MSTINKLKKHILNNDISMSMLIGFLESLVLRFLKNLRTRVMGIHSLRNDDSNVIFVDENRISLKLPRLSYIGILRRSQYGTIDRCISFATRPAAEVLLRNIVCKFYDQGILDKKKSVIDIGAWISDNAIIWAKTIDSEFAKVYAIDPSSDNIVFGKIVSELNGVKNISYHQNICSDMAGVELFFEGALDHATFNVEGKGAKSQSVSTTIDSIVAKKNHGSIGLLHIDVEGFEMLVIKGAERVILDSKPFILFEQHISQEKSEIICEYLRDRGYKIYMINEVLPGCNLDCRNFLAIPLDIDLSNFIRNFDHKSISVQVYEAMVAPVLISV